MSDVDKADFRLILRINVVDIGSPEVSKTGEADGVFPEVASNTIELEEGVKVSEFDYNITGIEDTTQLLEFDYNIQGI